MVSRNALVILIGVPFVIMSKPEVRNFRRVGSLVHLKTCS